MPLILILKIIAIIIAGLCFYISVFLYEDREKIIQNKLEDLWIKIDDAQSQMLSKHTVFLKAIADLMTRGFDYIFGRKLVSFRSVGVTLCFSNAWISIGTVVANIVLYKLDPIFRAQTSNLITSGEAFDIAFGVFYGMLPAYLSHRPWRIRWISWQKIWGLGLLCMLYDQYISDPLRYAYVFLVYSGKPNLVILPILFFLLFAVPMLLFVAFTILLRSSTKRIAQAKSSGNIALIYLINSLPVITFALMIKLWLLKIDYFSIDLLMDIFFAVLIILSVVFNLLFLLTTAIFVLLGLTLLVHRLLWPLLARTTYALQRYGIAKRSKLVGTIGVLLVFAVFGKIEWLDKIIDKINPF
jgi:hypothetical protein